MFRFLLVSFLFLASNVWAQDRTISGNVTADDDGSGLPGVNVILQGTTVGTTTDIDGSYSLDISGDGGTLVFSFIGLASQEIEVGARSVIDQRARTDGDSESRRKQNGFLSFCRTSRNPSPRHE